MIPVQQDISALSQADRLAGLRRIIPRSLVRQVLEESGKDRRSCSRLPTAGVVWFMLALGLFCRDCYRQVYRWLFRWNKLGIPPRSSLCEARHRLGVRPLALLARQTVKLLAQPSTPGAFYHNLRVMAVDGFVVDVPDTPAHERVFGRPPGDRAPGAFPQVRVVGLCEAGTHVLWRWLIKPITVAEQVMVDALLKFLAPGMLLLWDRNFLSYQRVQTALGSGAQLLVRISSWPIFQPIQRLSDGSFLAKLYRNPVDRQHDRQGILVRIIEYSLDDPQRPAAQEKHRLLTSLLDEKLYPALELVELYHQRWEEELSIDELKTHQLERPVLRSQTPAGVVQELYALLIDHFVVRTLMFQAAGRQDPPMDPRRLSFTGTLKILRCRMAECPRKAAGRRLWWERLLEEIAQEPLPPRRDRINPRVIKRKYAKWKVKRPEHRRYPQPTKSFRDSIVMLR